LRALCRYPDDQYYSDIVFDEEAAYAYRATEPMQLEIPRTIYWAEAFGEFDEPDDVPNENIIEAALKVLPWVMTEKGFGGYYVEGVEELYEAAGKSEFIPKEWVEIFAGNLLGKKLEIEHKSLPELNIEYNEEAGIYISAGTERGFRYPYITEIEYYEYGGGCYVKYFYITIGIQGFSLGDSGEWLVPGEVPLWEDERVLEFAESGKDIYSADLYERDDRSFYLRHMVKEPQEPELIAEHIAALNEIENETFFVDFDWSGESWQKLFKSNDPLRHAADYPDALINSKELLEYRSGDYYNGYYIDSGGGECMPAKNFKTKEEVIKYLEQWVDRSVFDYEGFGSINENLIEFEGILYVFRGSRGYGISYYGDSEIVEQTETEMTAVAKIYRIVKNEVGTAEIKFEKRDGNWIIVSVENNYY